MAFNAFIEHVLRAFALSLVLFTSMNGHSLSVVQEYSNAINNSAWKVSTSVFACRLTHDIPYYGQAVFQTRAGETSAFHLRAKASRLKAGEVEILAASPVWVSESTRQSLAVVAGKQGTRPLWLSRDLTEKMLASLSDGKNLELVGSASYGAEASQTRVTVSPIGFQQNYETYLGCLSGLMPRNFDQLKRSALLFPGGTVDKLPKDVRRTLDHILLMVKHDPKIKAFYIDGHTDALGDRIENLELSKLRAEMVAEYLKVGGIPDDAITVRWHGERYPVASNANSSGRAKNRRVTIRLEKKSADANKVLAAN